MSDSCVVGSPTQRTVLACADLRCRVATMTDKALTTRIGRITKLDKLESFIKVSMLLSGARHAVCINMSRVDHA